MFFKVCSSFQSRFCRCQKSYKMLFLGTRLCSCSFILWLWGRSWLKPIISYTLHWVQKNQIVLLPYKKLDWLINMYYLLWKDFWQFILYPSSPFPLSLIKVCTSGRVSESRQWVVFTVVLRIFSVCFFTRDQNKLTFYQLFTVLYRRQMKKTYEWKKRYFLHVSLT